MACCQYNEPLQLEAMALERNRLAKRSMNPLNFLYVLFVLLYFVAVLVLSHDDLLYMLFFLLYLVAVPLSLI
jgi:hypothetical protein